jgi:hypothetical protein
MKRYRFRSNYRVDVEVLMSVLPDAIYEITPLHPRHSDVEVEMITKFDIDYVIKIIKTLPEGTTMAETIALSSRYVNTFKPTEGFSGN